MVVTTLIAFYCLDFFFQISNSLVAQELTLMFATDSLHLGMLTSAFYLGYVGMQIPAGLLLDYYQPKIIVPLAFFTATCCFAASTIVSNIYWAYLLRLILGASSAFAFISILAYSLRHFSQSTFFKICSITISIGTLSSSLFEMFFSVLLKKYSWQLIFIAIALIGLIITLLLILVQGSLSISAFSAGNNKACLKKTFKDYFGSKKLLSYGVIGGFLYLPTNLLAALWGIPFMMFYHHMSKYQSAVAIMYLFSGWAVGAFVLSFFKISDRMVAKVISIGAVLATVMSYLFIHLYFSSAFGVDLSLFFMGLFSSCQVLIWDIFSRQYTNQNIAIGSAFNNMIIQLMPIIFHLVIGYLSISNYQTGLFIIPYIFLTIALFSWFLCWQDKPIAIN